MSEEYLISLTPVGILFLIFIREFFSYLKTKKNGSTINYEKELALMNSKLDNHITAFCEDLRDTKEDIKIMRESIFSIKIAISKIETSLTTK